MTTEIDQQGPCVMLASGRRMYPFDPLPEHVDLADIALGLAAKARFNGQVWPVYTVAQHSVAVADQIWAASKDRDAALWGLLHDGAEAYLPDVTRPIKGDVLFRVPMFGLPAIVPFDFVERQILAAIADRFGLPWPIPAIVNEVDDRMLATERRDFFAGLHPYWIVLADPYPWKLNRESPQEALEGFLQRFEELNGGEVMSDE